MKYILALDQGTTSSRAAVFDRTGSLVSLAQREFRQIFPRPGLVEQDGEEIWESQYRVARDAVEGAGLGFEAIEAIGITNQRETTLVWDRRTGKPLGNAIVWQDRRTAGECERLRVDGKESLFRKKTGLLLDPYFSGTKLAWVLKSHPDAHRLASRGDLAFGTVDSWLLWRLTGGQEHVTDPGNASRTLLFNIHSGDWDPELLAILGIPAPLLPEVKPSSGFFGETSEKLFGRRIPVTGVAGDQQAALFGQMCVCPGMVKNTYGTGCFVLMHTGSRPVDPRGGLLATVAWRIGEKTEYALEGSVFTAGAAVQWLRDGLGIIRTSAEVEPLAASVPDSGGVVLVPAFSGLGAPHWDPYARGLLIGLTRGTTAAHIARATLESIAFQTDDLLRAMMEDAGLRVEELRVDGGASVNNLLMQFQADLLGARVVRPASPEITAFGAACLAGLAVGFWRDRAEIAELWRPERVYLPAKRNKLLDGMRRGWLRALERARGWDRDD